MNSVIELKPEYATVSYAVRFDGDEGIEEQRRALQALRAKCGSRGLQEAVKQQKRHIEAMEREYSASAPAAFAVGASEVNGRGDQFRHGSYRDQAYMTVDDFAAYYSQSRKSTPTARGARTAAATVTAKDCMDSGVILCSAPAVEKRAQKRAENNKQRSRGALVARIERAVSEWFSPDDRMLRCNGRSRAFPMASVVCFVVIAVSLMLLVSGTVMVAGARQEVGELRNEVDSLAEQAHVLENQMEAQTDYLEIYRIATEEYGMVDADFVNGTHLSSAADSYIEVFDKPDDTPTGLATLLAAIGIRIGD